MIVYSRFRGVVECLGAEKAWSRDVPVDVIFVRYTLNM
jgi:hypothetical protein